MTWHHAGCCPPGGLGDPRVGKIPPWMGGFGEPKGCHPLCGCWAENGHACCAGGIRFVRSAHPRAAGIWGWGLPLTLLSLGGGDGMQPPVPILLGSAAVCHLYHNCELVAIGRKQDKAFLHHFRGLRGGGLHLQPAPTPSLRAIQGSRAGKCLNTSPNPPPTVLWVGAGHRLAMGVSRLGGKRGVLRGALLQPLSGTNVPPSL